MGRRGASLPRPASGGALAPTTAVVPAAGAGQRLGADGPKALVEVAGRPMLEWSLRAFAAAPEVGEAIVAAQPGAVDRFAQLAADVGADQDLEVRVVAGGGTRSESVAAALEPVESDVVAVHDAARPLLWPELIGELVEKLLGRPDAAGVIAASPIVDTVKRAREPRPPRGEVARGGPTVAKTESRDHLWAAQTPQVFRTRALRDALRASPQRLAEATDDAWLVEKDGGKVVIHPASPENLKVTTPLDLRMAGLLLSERERGGGLRSPDG